MKHKLNIMNDGIIIEPLKGKPVLEMMRVIRDMLFGYRMKYWFSAGTTLGLVREEQGFINHDTDIDLEVLITDNEAHQILDLMISTGFKLVRRMDWNGKFMQLAFLEPKLKIIIDFYFYHIIEDDDDEYVYNYNEGGTLRILKSMISEFDAVRGFPCPKPVRDYLRFRYGKDWMIPRSGKTGWVDDAGEALLK